MLGFGIARNPHCFNTSFIHYMARTLSVLLSGSVAGRARGFNPQCIFAGFNPQSFRSMRIIPQPLRADLVRFVNRINFRAGYNQCLFCFMQTTNVTSSLIVRVSCVHELDALLMRVMFFSYSVHCGFIIFHNKPLRADSVLFANRNNLRAVYDQCLFCFMQTTNVISSLVVRVLCVHELDTLLIRFTFYTYSAPRRLTVFKGNSH